MTDEEQEKLKQISSAINNIKEMNPEESLKKKGGQIFDNFKDILPTVEKIKDLVQTIDIDILKQGVLTSNQLSQMNTRITSCETSIAQLINYQVQNNTPIQDIKRPITENYNDAVRDLAPIIPFINLFQRTSITKLKKDINNQVKSKIAELDKIKESAESIEKSLRESAEKTAVSSQAIYFQEQADKHKALSHYWLFASLFMVVVSIGAPERRKLEPFEGLKSGPKRGLELS